MKESHEKNCAINCCCHLLAHVRHGAGAGCLSVSRLWRESARRLCLSRTAMCRLRSSRMRWMGRVSLIVNSANEPVVYGSEASVYISELVMGRGSTQGSRFFRLLLGLPHSRTGRFGSRTRITCRRTSTLIPSGFFFTTMSICFGERINIEGKPPC